MSAVKLPNNLRMSALILDREHAPAVDKLRSHVKNADAKALLSLWQRSPQFNFLVLAGPLHRDRGIVGGMAKDWEQAMPLIRRAAGRLDDVAKARGDFSSAWNLYVTAPRQKMVQELFAEAQQTAGTA